MIANAQNGVQFFTTQWSLVAIAIDSSSPQTRAALEKLCQDYWPPLFAYALRRGRDSHTAQDLTQSFFAHFIGRGYLRAADRVRGRFRTFLLTCFQHFLMHEWEKDRAAKRGGQFLLLSSEEHSAALEARAGSPGEFTPERHYDREWALAIMERALARLRMEYETAGQALHFKVLGHFLHTEAAPGDYLHVGRQLELTDQAVRLAVHRIRRRYGRFVREEVRDTVVNEADVEDEMRYLIELISA